MKPETFVNQGFLAFYILCIQRPWYARDALQEKHRDKSRILLGVEQNYDSNAPTGEYDYVIGFVQIRTKGKR